MKLNAIETALMNNPLREAIQRRFEARRLLEMGGPMRGGRALEVGCGRGVGVELILDRFGATEVDALDLDPEMVERARRRLARPYAAGPALRRRRHEDPGAGWPLRRGLRLRNRPPRSRLARGASRDPPRTPPRRPSLCRGGLRALHHRPALAAAPRASPRRPLRRPALRGRPHEGGLPRRLDPGPLGPLRLVRRRPGVGIATPDRPDCAPPAVRMLARREEVVAPLPHEERVQLVAVEVAEVAGVETGAARARTRPRPWRRARAPWRGSRRPWPCCSTSERHHDAVADGVAGLPSKGLMTDTIGAPGPCPRR